MSRLIFLMLIWGSVQAQAVSICNRSEAVQQGILQAISGRNCKSVSIIKLGAIEQLSVWGGALKKRDLDNLYGLKSLTIKVEMDELPADIFTHLQGLETLVITSSRLGSLKPSDFAGLTKLRDLQIEAADFKHLPADTFSEVPGLKTLILSLKNLESLDTNAFEPLSGLRNISLTIPSLKTLDPALFSTNLLLNSLSLISVQTDEVPCEVFRGLAWLRVLAIKSGRVKSIPDACFSDLKRLRVLDLSGNQIERIQPDQFKGLTNLVTLDLASNAIKTVEENSFEYLEYLDFLGFSANKLTSLNQGMFYKLSALQLVDFDRNPIKTLGANWHEGLDNLYRITFNQTPMYSELYGVSSYQMTIIKPYDPMWRAKRGTTSRNNIAALLLQGLYSRNYLYDVNSFYQDFKKAYSSLSFASLANYDLIHELSDQLLVDRLREAYNAIVSKDTIVGEVGNTLWQIPSKKGLKGLIAYREELEKHAHPAMADVDQAIKILSDMLRQSYDYKKYRGRLDPQLHGVSDAFFAKLTPHSLTELADLSLALFQHIKDNEGDPQWKDQYLTSTLHLKSYLKSLFKESFLQLQKQDAATFESLVKMSVSYDLLSDADLLKLEEMATKGVPLRERAILATGWQRDKIKDEFSFADDGVSDLLPSPAKKITESLIEDSILTAWQAF